MNTVADILDRIRCDGLGNVAQDVPLSSLSTFKIGGCADGFVEPVGVDALVEVLRRLTEAGIARVVIGDGSNLLFDDAGLQGVVVRIARAMGTMQLVGRMVRAEAGVAWPRLVRRAVQAGLGGLESTAGVPGTLGGMVVMNGGCFGQTVGEVVRRVTAVDSAGRVVSLSGEACRFTYRRSTFQADRSDWVVAAAELELTPGDRQVLRDEMRARLRERRTRFPRYRKEPNCGSVFRSQPELYERFGPPGRVIEQCGCKGWRQGGAEVSRQHANFILAGPGATSADVLGLIKRIRYAVAERTGLVLECEVRHVLPTGEIVSAGA